jgi:hypothetical protein
MTICPYRVRLDASKCRLNFRLHDSNQYYRLPSNGISEIPIFCGRRKFKKQEHRAEHTMKAVKILLSKSAKISTLLTRTLFACAELRACVTIAQTEDRSRIVSRYHASYAHSNM